VPGQYFRPSGLTHAPSIRVGLHEEEART